MLKKILLFIILPFTAFAQNSDSTLAIRNYVKIPKQTSTFKLADFYSNSTALATKVDSIYNAWNVDQRAAQMIMPAYGINNFGVPLPQLQEMYNNNIIGGVLLLKGTSAGFKNVIDKFNATSIENNLPPLMYTCDGEPALFHYKFVGHPKMIPAEQQTTTADVIRESGKAVKHLKSLGIQINFAPVVDNNINRAIIKNRSFGLSSNEIVQKATAFVTNHQQNGVGAVIKHFPGHGNVKGDSHIGLVKINGELTEANTFATLIQSVKPIGVMVGHIAIDNNELYNTYNLPATLSNKIVTDLLKKTYKFEGIVFTDAMNMGAVNKINDASYKAACAGIDVVLMPLNCKALHYKIKSDLIANNFYGKQFEKSIKKIIRLKVVLGIL